MKRRGVGLVVALVVTTVVGAAVSLMSLHAMNLARRHQHDRARMWVRSLAESGAAYAHTYRGVRSTATAPKGIELPTASLVPAGTEARLVLTAEPNGATHVTAQVTIARFHLVEELQVAD